MLPEKAMANIEAALSGYHLRKSERLEDQAHSVSGMAGSEDKAARLFKMAAFQARLARDRDREVMLLLRSTDSFEEHASTIERMAYIGPQYRTPSILGRELKSLSEASANLEHIITNYGHIEFIDRSRRIYRRGNGLLEYMLNH